MTTVPQARGSNPETRPEPLLRVEHLRKWFPIRTGLFSTVQDHVKAVDDVSFTIAAGQTLGLVGESGCGKTTAGRTILRLYEPSGGAVYFEGRPVFRLRAAEMRAMRRRMQIIFQDPYGSLDPRMAVGSIVGEPLRIHGIARGRALRDRVAHLLDRVGLRPDVVHRYPHEFSGGQRQRIGIARALALGPKFIVCDEPTSALDVSVRAQIINLLADLQAQDGLSYLMISHDLAVVRHVSHAVAVMYLGKVVEQAATDRLYAEPLHPYTRVLLSAIPVPDPRRRPRRVKMAGDGSDLIPTPRDLPEGCPFRPRCPLHAWLRATDPPKARKCLEAPPLEEKAPGHHAACWYEGLRLEA